MPVEIYQFLFLKEVKSASASSTDAEEMDKILFADSPQDGEEATVEEGSC